MDKFNENLEKNTIKILTLCFSPASDGIAESHTTLQIQDASLSFEEQLKALLEAYGSATEGKTVLFRRFFLSDPATQAKRLEAGLADFPEAATSVIGQPPLDGTKIAAWVYAVSGGEIHDGVFTHNGYRHFWNGGMVSGGIGPEAQTGALFESYDSFLSAHGMSVGSNCLRTWLFVRDVDHNYAGVVKSRRDYFSQIGLTPDTHFIASTGIEGNGADPGQIVHMDAYSASGLQDGQVQYLHAYGHLSPTALYGVTFERGTAIIYGDRRHVLISGTASIDKEGNVLFVDDPVRQTERLLENIEALLSEAGASFLDIAYSIIYLRNATDYQCVRDTVRRLYSFLDPVYVLAPVCRPAWLVEMECWAITSSGDKSYKVF